MWKRGRGKAWTNQAHRDPLLTGGGFSTSDVSVGGSCSFEVGQIPAKFLKPPPSPVFFKLRMQTKGVV